MYMAIINQKNHFEGFLRGKTKEAIVEKLRKMNKKTNKFKTYGIGIRGYGCYTSRKNNNYSWWLQ